MVLFSLLPVHTGAHDPLEPEYSILKSRIARRIKYEKGDVQEMTLVDITKVAERVITTVSGCCCITAGSKTGSWVMLEQASAG